MPLSSTLKTKTAPLLIMDRRSSSFRRRVIRGIIPHRAACMSRRASAVVSTKPQNGTTEAEGEIGMGLRRVCWNNGPSVTMSNGTRWRGSYIVEDWLQLTFYVEYRASGAVELSSNYLAEDLRIGTKHKLPGDSLNLILTCRPRHITLANTAQRFTRVLRSVEIGHC